MRSPGFSVTVHLIGGKGLGKTRGAPPGPATVRAVSELSQREPPADDPLRGWVDDDLADRLAGQERVDIDLTAAELADAELARTPWLARLSRAPGRAVAVSTATGQTRRGTLLEVLTDALVVEESGRWVLVAATSVLRVQGPEGSPVVPGPNAPTPWRRPRSGAAVLRQWAAQRRAVSVRCLDGVVLHGMISAVGADHLVVEPAAPEAGPVGGPVVVVWPAVVDVILPR